MSLLFLFRAAASPPQPPVLFEPQFEVSASVDRKEVAGVFARLAAATSLSGFAASAQWRRG